MILLVKVSLEADLNPIMKMMADPVNKFLEKLIGEMESFRDWKISENKINLLKIVFTYFGSLSSIISLPPLATENIRPVKNPVDIPEFTPFVQPVKM